MSQDFRELLATSIIKDDREAINENFQSIRSCNSGTAAPTTNLVEGMLFFNSQTQKLYQLMPDLTTWVLFADFSSGTTYVAKAGNAETAAKATGDKNGKDVTSYIAKLEQDADDAFSIKVYNGANTLINTITIPKTEINVMTGASASSAGTSGLVPTPQAGEQDKFLRGDGTFAKAGAVDSVNGQTGDVQVGEVIDVDIDGTTITVTFADGTTKTLNTQDTVNTYNGTVSQKSSTTSNGTWSITGLTIGKPLHIIFNGNAANGKSAYLTVLSGSNDGGSVMFAVGQNKSGGWLSSISATIIPTATTVAVDVSISSSCTLRAYQ